MPSREELVLEYVEGSEFRRQLARRVADAVLAEHQAEILDGTIDAAAVMDDAAMTLEDILIEAAHDSIAHADVLGFTGPVDESVVAELVKQGLESVHGRAESLLGSAMDEIAATVETLPPGVEIDAASATGKALFSGARSVLRSTMSGYVSEVERSSMNAAIAPTYAENPETLYAWETRIDDKVCDDQFENSCAPRHGWNLTMEDWDVIGHPGDQNLLCSLYSKGATSNCRCQLVPGSVTDTFPGGIDVSDAVKRGRSAADQIDLGEAG